jgi:hypothetical protein
MIKHTSKTREIQELAASQTWLDCFNCAHTHSSSSTSLHSLIHPSFPIANKSAAIDKASRVLAQPVPPSLSESYRARADRSGVPHTTLHHRARGRRSIEEKAQSGGGRG